MSATVGSVRVLLGTARECLRTERRRAVDEREAFRAFGGRLRGNTPAGDSTAPLGRVTTTLCSVRDAYEETVMMVPHYTEKYNEPYPQHVERELGPDVATILTRGQSFDRRHRQTVLSAVTGARDRRTRCIDRLDDEETALAEFAGELVEVAQQLDDLGGAALPELSVGALEGHYTRLGTLQAVCEEVVDRRQSALIEQRRTLQSPHPGPDIPARVYTDLDVDYPVVAAATELLERIDATQRETADAIGSAGRDRRGCNRARNGNLF
jgi:hypothetical protein